MSRPKKLMLTQARTHDKSTDSYSVGGALGSQPRLLCEVIPGPPPLNALNASTVNEAGCFTTFQVPSARDWIRSFHARCQACI